MNILEAIKSGRKVQTRDGHSVRVLCTDYKNDKYPIVAVIDFNSHERICTYAEDGRASANRSTDLVLKPIKVKRWFNIYRDPITDRIYHGCCNYNSEEEAKNSGILLSNYLCSKYYEIEN